MNLIFTCLNNENTKSVIFASHAIIIFDLLISFNNFAMQSERLFFKVSE